MATEVTAVHFEPQNQYSENYQSHLEEIEEIEDILGDPAKFHRKLLTNGIVDHDYVEFLNELDESGKYETSNIKLVEQYYTKEIDRLKNFYEGQIQQIKEESEHALVALQEENQALSEKCNFLTDQNNELLENQNKKAVPKKNSTNKSFLRRGSENSKLVRKSNSLWRKDMNNSKGSNSSQTREQEDLQLKKQIDGITKNLKSQWEAKLDVQKKETKAAQTKVSEISNQLNQQKTQHQKETNKNKDQIKRLERDIRALKRNIAEGEKEKDKLKEKIALNIDTKCHDHRNKRRLDLSKSTARSHNDLDLFSKRLSSNPNGKGNTFFERHNSITSRKDNKLFSSTASLQSFNLLKSCKNFGKKNGHEKCKECEKKTNDQSNKGNFI